eukprot:CAMPEP_0177649568 /NCGR_PEP_ID=MMETSP0447-20121125/11465_1 /TAXON_ID=0 /ORGANISM="Stygamoeba regulata, Strain BSH-02190019" /LENGTH=744 /DNA_ID=CAMNT_0019152353 /DNA_START=147 /DNA_END=2381 /DNA_ORIENTATION=+
MLVFLVVILLVAGPSVGLPTRDGKTTIIAFISRPTTTQGLFPLAAVELALKEIAEDTETFPNVKFKLWHQLPASADDTQDVFQKAVGEEGISFVVGPSSTDYVRMSGVTAKDLDTLIMTHTATSTILSSPVYVNTFRVIPADDVQCAALASIAQEFDIRNVAVVSASDGFSTSLATCLLDQLETLDVKVLAWLSYRAADREDLKGLIIDQIQNLGVRVVYVLGQSFDLQDFVWNAQQRDLTGFPYIFIMPETGLGIRNSFGAIADEDIKKLDLEGLLVTSQFGGKKNDARIKRIQQAGEAADLPPVDTPYHMYAYDSVYAYAYALERLLSGGASLRDITTADLRESLQAESHSGITGKVEFKPNGDRLSGTFSVFNFQDGAFVEVGSFVGTKLTIEGELRFPGGSSRIFDTTPSLPKEVYVCSRKEVISDKKGIIQLDGPISDPEFLSADKECDSVVDCKNWADEGFGCAPSLAVADVICGILALLCAITILVCLAIMRIRRDHKVAQATDPLFTSVVSFVSLFGTLSVVLLFGQANDITCQLRIWVYSVLSSVFIGAIGAKQYRILRIFGNTSMKPVVIRTTELFPIIAAVVIPDLVVLTIWTIVDRYEADDVSDHYNCTSSLELVWILILVFYKGVLLVILSVMAFISRHFPGKYSESTQLGIAIYNTLIISIILMPVILVVDVPFLQFVFGCMIVIGFFFAPWAIMMFPKIYFILFGTNTATTFVFSEKSKDFSRTSTPTR